MGAAMRNVKPSLPSVDNEITSPVALREGKVVAALAAAGRPHALARDTGPKPTYQGNVEPSSVLDMLVTPDMEKDRLAGLDRRILMETRSALATHKNIVQYGSLSVKRRFTNSNGDLVVQKSLLARARWALLRDHVVGVENMKMRYWHSKQRGMAHSIHQVVSEFSHAGPQIMIPGLSEEEHYQWNIRRMRNVWIPPPRFDNAAERRKAVKNLKWLPPMQNSRPFGASEFDKEMPFLRASNVELGGLHTNDLISTVPREERASNQLKRQLEASQQLQGMAKHGTFPFAHDEDDASTSHRTPTARSRSGSPSRGSGVRPQSSVEDARTDRSGTFSAGTSDSFFLTETGLGSTVMPSPIPADKSEPAFEGTMAAFDHTAITKTGDDTMESMPLRQGALKRRMERFQSDHTPDAVEKSLMIDTDWRHHFRESHKNSGSTVRTWRHMFSDVEATAAEKMKAALRMRDQHRAEALSKRSVYDTADTISSKDAQTVSRLRRYRPPRQSHLSMWDDAYAQTADTSIEVSQENFLAALLRFIKCNDLPHTRPLRSAIQTIRRELLDDRFPDKTLLLAAATAVGSSGARDPRVMLVLNHIAYTIGEGPLTLARHFDHLGWDSMALSPMTYETLPWIDPLEATARGIAHSLKPDFSGETAAERKQRALMYGEVAAYEGPQLKPHEKLAFKHGAPSKLVLLSAVKNKAEADADLEVQRTTTLGALRHVASLSHGLSPQRSVSALNRSTGAHSPAGADPTARSASVTPGVARTPSSNSAASGSSNAALLRSAGTLARSAAVMGDGKKILPAIAIEGDLTQSEEVAGNKRVVRFA